jgi:hypothetical protein
MGHSMTTTRTIAAALSLTLATIPLAAQQPEPD